MSERSNYNVAKNVAKIVDESVKAREHLNLFAVILSFLKVGVIGFGGGAALIPVIETELVQKKKWIDKERFDYSVVVASLSPASLPVALCSIWNHKFSLVSAYAYALPGPILFLILSTGFSVIGEAGVRYIGFASVGIITFILLVLYSFIGKNYQHGTKKIAKWQYIFFIAVSFLLTCGSIAIRLGATLFGIEELNLVQPIFGLSMINLLIIAFFIIFFVGKAELNLKMVIAAIISMAYALANGGIGIFEKYSSGIAAMMVILALCSIVYDAVVNRSKVKFSKIDTKPLKNLLIFLLIPVLLTTVVFFVFGVDRTIEFAWGVMLSSLTSFGGGEAYIAVADAVFVQTGFISSEVYYSRIIGISSAMPGPVLMSIAAGIGFEYGSIAGGWLLGWIYGLLAINLAIAATALGALILYTCFEIFRDSQRFQMIMIYVMPLVCGMLISIALTLLYQASSVLIREGLNPLVAAGSVILLFLIMMFLRKKCRLNDLTLLLSGGLGTLGLLTVLF